MSFKFGVSYNCEVDSDCVGGFDEGCSSLDMVGNDLDKVINYITNYEKDGDLICVREGGYIGKECSQGGKVVAYFGYDDGCGDIYPTIVVFEDPTDLTVIE